ncbi:hypothetical protein NA63_2504 [Flavobacteriaceae bacterium MAR_2010_105]|nr:hypothetical protein NA63_2504 [Flavobacteriaceae bacterium MAR_2010_105]
MTLSQQIANQFRDVMLSGNWVATNFKTQLSEVSWQEANTKIDSLNSIAALTFHIHYYIEGLIKVLKGGTLDIKDKYSFDAPPINSKKDWDLRLDALWKDAETFADLIEQLSDDDLMSAFVEERYGNNFINIQALIEHSYYHLGQIVLIKKMLSEKNKNKRNSKKV